MKAICAAVLVLCAGTMMLSCDDDDNDAQAPLDGYWDLYSYYDSKTGDTTPVSSGTSIIHFHGGNHEYYYDLGTPGYTTGTYTVNGNQITYNTGTVDAYGVAESSLRLTTVTSGDPFNKNPGSYSDFNRLGSFDPAPYGTCK